MGHRKRDHHFNMRNNIDTQPLAAVRAQDLGRFRPVFSGYDEKFKRMHDDEEMVQEEEYIDVIGEYPVSEPEPEVVHPKAQSLLLEQPPSKIYYDNIEKESSDGGFFDRDDLEDEDERNELVIDCKLLNGGAGGAEDQQPPLKKKTDLRICEPNPQPQTPSGQKFLFPPTTTPSTSSSDEPEVVFNFTLVDTQLVFNESKLVSPKDVTSPVISVHIPAAAATAAVATPAPPQPPPRPSVLQQQLEQNQRISSQLRNLKDLRTRPYGERPPRMMPNDPRRMSRSYRAAHGGGVMPQVKRALQQRLIGGGGGGRLAGEQQNIGSGRVRSSAFAPPTKSHYTGRDPSVQQLPAAARISSRRSSIVPSYTTPQPGVDRLPKNSSSSQPPPPSLPRAYVKIIPRKEPRTLTYLPVQFGFGTSVLNNLYDDQKPLDFSKDSPLWRYEAMLKGPREHQLQQGFHILNSMPIPQPPKPPPRAIRPKVVPLKRHPTLCLLRRTVQPPPPLPRLKVPPAPLPPPTTVIDLVSPTTPPETTETPPAREPIRTAMQTQIDAFFVQRQKEICTALRAYNDERIDVDQLFNQLEQLEIRYNRDYLGLAGILIKRYGCCFRATLRVDYQWSERPQDFVEYFGNLRRQKQLMPRSSEATMDIYRMVVGGLLEQFRDSMEHFLSNNLVVPPTPPLPALK